MNITSDGQGGFKGRHTFSLGRGSSITIEGNVSPADVERLVRFATRAKSLITAGDVESAGWLDDAAKYAGMAKSALNSPIGQAAAAIVPYGGLIKSAAEGAADGLSMLQKTGIAKNKKTARRVARLHDPRYAAEQEKEIAQLKAKAQKGDKRAKLDLRDLRNAAFRLLRRQLGEERETNAMLRAALAEYGDPLAYAYDYETSGAESNASRVAALHLFTDQALSRRKATPQPSFGRLPLRSRALPPRR